jgi:maltooligosyltrehalose trehalohydrolase
MTALVSAPLDRTFGATFLGDGQTRFRLWAPGRDDVILEREDADPLPMRRQDDGWFELAAEAAPGTRYRYRLDADLAVPDPASRAQEGGVHGWSVVVDPAAYPWQQTGWAGRPWQETVLYELHAGLLGGFAGVRRSLPRLCDLGITAVELMPVNAFPGRRNWGYDGVLPFAPAEAYGTPDDLKALVDDAHRLGLMIFLDVVYNHFGPDGNYLGAYAPHFFQRDGANAWGQTIDFQRPEVRTFFTANVLYWLQEFRFDGLRFDAVHAIPDPTWLDEMAASVRAEIPDRHVHLVLENDDNRASHLTRDIDAQWNDDAHHVMHVLLTGEADGYYADYAEKPAAKLARALSQGFIYQGDPSPFRDGKRRGEPSGGLPPTAFVFFIQNHDQIGNRAFGERLTVLAAPEALEAAITLQCLAPHIPMLFMGEEDASTEPFLFFTDHNEDLAKAVREGRAREFKAFGAFGDAGKAPAIPDPNAVETFEASYPRPDAGTAANRFQLYRTLLTLRRQVIVPNLAGTVSEGAQAVGPAAVSASWRLGDGARLTIAANFAEDPLPMPVPAGKLLFASHAGAGGSAAAGTLDGRAAVAFLDASA